MYAAVDLGFSRDGADVCMHVQICINRKVNISPILKLPIPIFLRPMAALFHRQFLGSKSAAPKTSQKSQFPSKRVVPCLCMA